MFIRGPLIPAWSIRRSKAPAARSSCTTRRNMGNQRTAISYHRVLKGFSRVGTCFRVAFGVIAFGAVHQAELIAKAARLKRLFRDGLRESPGIGTKRHTCGLRFVPFRARYLLASNQA